MKELSESIELCLRVPNGSLEFFVYKTTSKREIQGLLNKHKILRVLFDGVQVYCWKADCADHFFVKQYIIDVDAFTGFMVEGADVIKSIETDKQLAQLFKERFL